MLKISNYHSWLVDLYAVDAKDADVVFKSSDAVLFHLHRKNLEVCTGGLPPGGFSTDGAVVDLAENSEVLEILFTFAYPSRRPSLVGVEFSILAGVAEAAEKYEVYIAMDMCYNRMVWGGISTSNQLREPPNRNYTFREQSREHPLEVLNYSTRHGYLGLADNTSPLTIGFTHGKIGKCLDLLILPIWV
jgi:hypothetical protein